MHSQAISSTVGASRLAVYRYVGTDSPQFPATRGYCQIFILCRKRAADCGMHVLPAQKYRFDSSSSIRVDLPHQSKAFKEYYFNGCPSLLVTPRLVQTKIK